MKVKELIQGLQETNPETEIVFHYNGCYEHWEPNVFEEWDPELKKVVLVFELIPDVLENPKRKKEKKTSQKRVPQDCSCGMCKSCMVM